MALDDMINREIMEKGLKVIRLQEMAKNLSNGQPAVSNGSYVDALQDFGDISPEQIEYLEDKQEWVIKDAMKTALPEAIESAGEKFSEIIEPYYSELVDDLSIEGLQVALINSPSIEFNRDNGRYERINDAKEELERWSERAERNNIGAYIRDVENSVFATVIRTATQEEIKELLNQRVRIYQNVFLRNFVDEEGKLDKKEMREYLKINSYEDKKTRTVIGEMYVRQELQRAQYSSRYDGNYEDEENDEDEEYEDDELLEAI